MALEKKIMTLNPHWKYKLYKAPTLKALAGKETSLAIYPTNFYYI